MNPPSLPSPVPLGSQLLSRRAGAAPLTFTVVRVPGSKQCCQHRAPQNAPSMRATQARRSCLAGQRTVAPKRRASLFAPTAPSIGNWSLSTTLYVLPANPLQIHLSCCPVKPFSPVPATLTSDLQGGGAQPRVTTLPSSQHRVVSKAGSHCVCEDRGLEVEPGPPTAPSPPQALWPW